LNYRLVRVCVTVLTRALAKQFGLSAGLGVSMSSLHTDTHSVGAFAEAVKALRGAVRLHLRGTKSLRSFLMIAAAIEFTSINAAAYLAVLIYHTLLGIPSTAVQQSKYFGSALFLSSTILLTSIVFRHFPSIQTRPLHIVLASGFGTVALAFSFLLSTMFLFKLTDEYSRGSFVFQLLGVSVVVLGGRAMLHFRLRSAVASGVLEARRVVLIGDPERCAQLANKLNPCGIQAVGAFSPPTSGDGADKANCERNARALVDACRSLNMQDILILADCDDWLRTVSLTTLFSELPVGLHIVPSEKNAFLSTSEILDFGNVTTIQVARPPLSVVDQAVKRVFDLCAAITGLILLAPLFLMVAIAIKLDSRGPVFFRQLRHGYNKEPISVFKFRSMNVMENSSDFIKQAQKDDPRVTRIGRMLRRSNIDELPQLLNVLRGEMSIVGPRPHATAHDRMFEELLPPYSRRHRIKPGISGWAQVNGYRGETDTIEKMQNRLEYDLHYIENWSFWFDVKIVFMTLFSKKTYQNAY
jgi:Undecaprenyl-phosphate glucose phosphotransferase